MARRTQRDQVWLCILESFVDGGIAVTPESIVNETGVSERTARDLLKTLVDEGLARESRIPDGRVKYDPEGFLRVD